MNGKGPLTDADYAKINEMLHRLASTKQETERGLQAGFDCGPEDTACKMLQDKLTQIKKVYWPERP